MVLAELVNSFAKSTALKWVKRSVGYVLTGASIGSGTIARALPIFAANLLRKFSRFCKSMLITLSLYY